MATFAAVFHGRVVAESDSTILLEGNRYFPLSSVDHEVLERSWMRSLCYWKGVASYYSLRTPEATEKHVAWTYRHPSPFARRIKGHVAFWPGSVAVAETPESSASPDR